MIFLRNRLATGTLLLGLVACQATPPQQPVPEIEQEPITTPEPLAELEPDPTEPIVDQNRLDYLAALDQLKRGETDVVARLEEISKLSPELEYLFTNLGLAYFKQRNFQQAKTAFERAISLNKSDAVAYNHLGIIARISGDFEQSRQHYENAIRADENYAAAYLNLGILFDIYLQDIEKALERYLKFQSLTDNEDKTVAGWIADIERRLKSG